MMETRSLHFIAESCGGRIVNGNAQVNVTGLSTDSRSVGAGNLFVTLSGPNFDAHDFLADVCGKGAAAAVVD
jgi:UDP-N-acetylmuramoyl-tripeptide--D-alanyl-D-alanine ligase